MKKLLLSLLFVLTLQAQAYGLTPQPEFYVNDYMGVLDAASKAELVEISHKLSAENGSQVVTVITDYYVGDDIHLYANQVFNDFGIGSANNNNGVLLLVALEAGEVDIQVGDGLSHIIPDSRAGSVLDEYFIANADDMQKAVTETHKQLISLCYRLDTASDYSDTETNSAKVSLFMFLPIIIFLLLLVIFFVSRPRRRYRRSSRPYIGIPPVTTRRRSGWNMTQGGSGPLDSFGGGGGKSSGGGASRSFGASSGSKRSGSFGGGSFRSSSFRGGGGRSSGGGASRSFGKK